MRICGMHGLEFARTAWYWLRNKKRIDSEADHVIRSLAECYMNSIGPEEDFDFQWKFLPSRNLAFTPKRVTEFLNLVRLPPSFFQGKLCLDAGCGSGRFTFALQQLGAIVDSFDISPAAVEKCREVNPKAYVLDLNQLKPSRYYDFVFCFGVLHHTENPRQCFSRLASQVHEGGMLHVMIYHKDESAKYDEARRLWRTMAPLERLDYCKKLALRRRGDLHGWWDALNPTLAEGFTPDEIRQWLREESFRDITLVHERHINMQGIFSEKT